VKRDRWTSTRDGWTRRLGDLRLDVYPMLYASMGFAWTVRRRNKTLARSKGGGCWCRLDAQTNALRAAKRLLKGGAK